MLNIGSLFGGMAQGGQQGIGGLLGAQAPMSLRGVLGGIGREGGGLIGKGFASLFGNKFGNVNFGGGVNFIPGVGFAKQGGGGLPWLNG